MIYKGNGRLSMEDGEPILRSCPKCNQAHKHLMKTNALHTCIMCGQFWTLGRFFDFKDDADFDKFFESFGLKKGESTQKLKDWERKITCITLSIDKKGGTKK